MLMWGKLLRVKRALVIQYLVLLILTMKTTKAMENITSRYTTLNEEQLMKGRFIGNHKRPRFLSFHTTDNDIAVEMQLSVPFLTIPIKKTMETASGFVDKIQNIGTVNLNLASIGLAGAVIFGTAFVFPSIFRLFSVSHINQKGVLERALNDDVNWIERIEQEINGKACAGKVICWLIHRSVDANARGNADSIQKIIDGLASNNWLMEYLKNTIFEEAIIIGYNKQNCSAKYFDCKINENSFQNIVKTVQGQWS